MEPLNQLILIGAVLIFLSILAGAYSARLGAPLLLVFMVLGLLAGEGGPGHIPFQDYEATFVVGSIALALILFDGGLHTNRALLRLALWPAMSLATVGIAITTAIVGGFAMLAMGLSWVEALLLGAILSSTDAAAIFLLLHRSDRDINRRVRGILEAESGMNDPMAVSLAILAVDLLLHPGGTAGWEIALDLTIDGVGGALFGLAGGWALRFIVNRTEEIAIGLYPVLVAAGAVGIFAAANSAGASGYLAVYLAGIVMGDKPYRAQQTVSRFHDGLIWLAQIAMFLLLGLLVSPDRLLDNALIALAVAIVLLFVARPVAVWLCLVPFAMNWREKTFISWVGIRGAVPIFLASIPIVAGLEIGVIFLDIAFAAVLLSLLLQGWTALGLARALGLEVPPEPEPTDATLFELPREAHGEVVGYRLSEDSAALDEPIKSLALPKRSRLIGAIRDGIVLDLAQVERFQLGDYVMLLVPHDQHLAADRLFQPRPVPRHSAQLGLGEFVFEARTPASLIASQYGLALELSDPLETIGDYLRRNLSDLPVVGDRIKIGEAELVLRAIEEDRIGEVGLEIVTEAERLPFLRWLRYLRQRLRRR